jgi:hypothetical protein
MKNLFRQIVVVVLVRGLSCVEGSIRWDYYFGRFGPTEQIMCHVSNFEVINFLFLFIIKKLLAHINWKIKFSMHVIENAL